MKWLIALVAMFAFCASAADLNGTWKATNETANGNFETTFVFKADGAKLTGTTANQFSGEMQIADGKIEGDNISFTVAMNFNGNEMKLNYKGKVAGNEIKMSVEVVGRDRTFEMTAKKTS